MGSWFFSWTLWITTLTLRVRYRPSGSAAIEPEGDQLLNTQCHPKVCWDSSRSGEREGVRKQSFLTLKATKPSGRKDRFTTGDGNVKRIRRGKIRCRCIHLVSSREERAAGTASLTLKAAQWSGAGGVALHPNKPNLPGGF
jgi:hypothetical protein